MLPWAPRGVHARSSVKRRKGACRLAGAMVGKPSSPTCGFNLRWRQASGLASGPACDGVYHRHRFFVRASAQALRLRTADPSPLAPRPSGLAMRAPSGCTCLAAAARHVSPRCVSEHDPSRARVCRTCLGLWPPDILKLAWPVFPSLSIDIATNDASQGKPLSHHHKTFFPDAHGKGRGNSGHHFDVTQTLAGLGSHQPRRRTHDGTCAARDVPPRPTSPHRGRGERTPPAPKRPSQPPPGPASPPPPLPKGLEIRWRSGWTQTRRWPARVGGRRKLAGARTGEFHRGCEPGRRAKGGAPCECEQSAGLLPHCLGPP